MAKTQERTGKLRVLSRLPSSRNGNPRYLLDIGGTVCRTAPDSGLAYSITNYEGDQVRAKIGTYRGHLTVHNVERA